MTWLRIEIGAWMVRLAISVVPSGPVRDTLRTACVLRCELMERKAQVAEGNAHLSEVNA